MILVFPYDSYKARGLEIDLQVELINFPRFDNSNNYSLFSFLFSSTLPVYYTNNLYTYYFYLYTNLNLLEGIYDALYTTTFRSEVTNGVFFNASVDEWYEHSFSLMFLRMYMV